MIKETFSARENEIHRSDTIAEQLSLSDRFGLRILFERPNKQTYIEIVKCLLKAREIDYQDEDLEQKAELYAIRAGGRSVRLAKQFAETF